MLSIKTDNLYHIKWPRNKSGYRSIGDLSEEFPLTIILKPNIPNIDPSREDSTTPRISFATSIEGAYGSLGISNISDRFYLGVYKPSRPVDVFYPLNAPLKDKKFYVHDAEKWGEVWSLRPVIAELYKIVAPWE